MFKKHLLIIGYFFFMLQLALPAFSQYKINHFTTEDGLPSNGIKGLEWDETTGFLWIATEAGLVRYNGMRFKTFDIKTNPEFGSNRIVKMVKNAAGKLLVAGDEGNLSQVKENGISLSFNGAQFARNNYNYYCAIAASDTLFRQCFKMPWPGAFWIQSTVVVPVNDTFCLALNAGRLYRYSVSTTIPEPLLFSPLNIKTAFKISEGVFFLNALNQVFVVDVAQHTSRREVIYDANGKPFLLTQKNSKLIWQPGMDVPVLIQDGNAWVIEKQPNQQLQCRLIASGIPENALFNYAQYVKNGNHLFLGTVSKGIYFIDENQLVSKQPAEININQANSFNSQIELPNGNIITNQGIVIGDNPSTNKYNVGNYFLNSVFSLNDSLLIFSRSDSLFIYNQYTSERKFMMAIATKETFSFAFLDKDLYFVNQHGIGLIKGNKFVDFIKFFNAKSAVHLHPSSMVAMADGRLALATCDGLLAFNPKTNRLDTLLKLPSICIRTLHKEGEYIFMGTYGGGFYVMKNGLIKSMPPDVSQYLKYSHCFIKDREGFYWISTNNGLFKVKLTDIIDAYEKDLPQIYYHYLGKEDGMQTTEMNGGCTPCALRLRNDNFSFPTMDGMLWFNPEKTALALPAGNIYIDEIWVDNRQQNIAGNEMLQFSQQAKRIDISLAVNAWCRKENLYIDYNLNDGEWLKADMVAGDPRISFSNLSYGKYKLTIRKMNGFGINNYSYSTIAFRIARPFYQQWWFRVLAILLFAVTGYLIFRLRLRQYDIKEKKLSALVAQKTMDLNLKNIELEKNDQIKTRLISVINHDIITPLKFMHYAGKALVENKGMIDPAQQLETISDITQTAKDMEMLSSQILNWIIYQNPNERMQKEEFDLHLLVEMVFGVLQFPARLKQSLLQNNVPSNFVVYQYMEPLRVLVYNLLLNAINFTKEGIVSVACRMEDERVIVEVADNGLGMTHEQINNLLSDEKIIASANVDNKKGTGLGYLIIKDLLKMMGGQLNIISNKGSGTRVAVSLPLK